ncbi:MAG: DUF2206 domain-containing protein [Dehalococcoidales bacterium]|jgi:uncharacterized membrane protein
MSRALKNLSGNWFFWFLIFLAVTDLSMLLDVPVLRQVLVFILLGVMPGWLVLRLLRPAALGLPEKAVLSVGLSVIVVCLAALLINAVYPRFGYHTPLSADSLVISFNVLLLVLAALAYFLRGGALPPLAGFRLNLSEKAFLLLPAFFPLLGIIGIRLMNTGDNNVLLLALLFLVILCVLFLWIFRHRVPPRVFPLVVMLISVSLLLVITLRDHHIMGVDIHREYYLAQMAADAQVWHVVPGDQLSSCLVTSLMPAVYQPLVNMDPEYLFGLLHLFTAVFTPLVVFIIARKYLGDAGAFLAAFFFIAQENFLAIGGGRVDYAVFFFALLIMSLFHERLSGFHQKLLFICCSTGLIISHYSAAFIALFIIVFAWLLALVFKAVASRWKKLRYASGGLTFGLVAIFVVLLFLWDSQLTHTAFTGAVEFARLVFRNLYNMFILESRSTWVASAFGVGLGAKGVPHQIEFVAAWLTIALIAVGVLLVLLRHRRTLVEIGPNAPPGVSLVHRVELSLLAMALAGVVIMAAALVLPAVSIGYDIGRVYYQMMPLMSAFFIIGGMNVGALLRDRRVQALLLLVLVVYFACTSGLTYQLSGYPRSLVLNSRGDYFAAYFVHEQDSRAAQWLGGNRVVSDAIYTGYRGMLLVSQGKIPQSALNRNLVETYLENRPVTGYVFLRYENYVNGGIVAKDGVVYDLAQYPDLLSGKSRIYVSNGAAVYR